MTEPSSSQSNPSQGSPSQSSAPSESPTSREDLPSGEASTARPSRGAFRFLFSEAIRDRSFAIQSFVSIMLMAMVNLPLPLLNKVVIDSVIPTGQVVPLIGLGVLAFAVRGSASGFQVFQNYVVRRLMTGIGDRLRRSMMRSMLLAPYPRFVDGEIDGYVARLSGDVAKVETVIFDTIRFVVRPFCMLSVMVVVMVWVSVPATILILSVAPISVFTTRKLTQRLRELQQEVLSRRQALQQQVAGSLDGIRVIRSFGRERTIEERVGRSIEGYAEVAVEHATRSRILQSVIDGIVLIPWLAMVVFGGVLIRSGSLSLGDFMLFVTFEQLLQSPLGQFSHYLLQLRGEIVGTERSREVLALPVERASADKSSHATGTIASDELSTAEPYRGGLEFDRVTFEYTQGHPVLKDLSFRIDPGERVALVGPSGAGKSTLLGLLLGFYVPQSGVIRIDGRDLEEIPTAELRANIGVVFQDNAMFDATIRDNLLLARKDRTDDDVWDALRRAEAGEFVESLPERLDTLIGVKGLRLSGGQRQRLAIARVILKAPPIVALDEATSSLDSLTESLIQRALERMLDQHTSLTIAHRLSTVVGADRILYLEQGRVVEEGSHGELIQRPGRYRELFETQIAGLRDLD